MFKPLFKGFFILLKIFDSSLAANINIAICFHKFSIIGCFAFNLMQASLCEYAHVRLSGFQGIHFFLYVITIFDKLYTILWHFDDTYLLYIIWARLNTVMCNLFCTLCYLNKYTTPYKMSSTSLS